MTRDDDGLTQNERKVWDWLSKYCRGRRNGHSNQGLSQYCGLNERVLRQVIASLVCSHGKPIGSDPEFGIYVIEDATDRAIAEKCLRDHAFPTLARLKALKRATQRPRPALSETSEQMRLFA